MLVKADGVPQDLRLPLPDGATLQILTTRDTQDPDALAVLRHSAAHLLAEAVRRLYPGVKVAIGPPIENGFYYDFDFPTPINDADLEAIEAEVQRELAEGRAWEREEITADEARARFAAEGEPYKVELVDTAEGAISLYTQGDFTDLCRGPHLQTSAPIKAFKLTSLAGAYWRGDSENTQLTRIYGTAFFSQKDLDAHLELLEEARARDHRRLGTQLDLFHFDEHSPGSPFWHPEGNGDLQHARGSPPARERAARLLRGQDAADLRQGALGDLGPLGEVPREHVPDPDRRRAHVRDQADELPRAHAPVRQPAPQLPRPAAALRRGGAAPPQRARRSAPRAHAGPVRDAGRRAHLLLAGAGRRRARRLRSSISATSTASSGSSRAPSSRRGPTTSSAPTRSGTSPRASSSRRSSGTRSQYFVGEGEGSFYGPKIDLHITDALRALVAARHDPARRPDAGPLRAHLHGRRTTSEHPVFVIHRAFFGSFERFIGILIEHYGGAFPLWLAPVQVRVLAGERAAPRGRARRSPTQLRAAGLRVELDERDETLGKRIRDSEVEKVPVVVVFGERESEAALAVRTRGEGQSTRSLEELLADLARGRAPRGAGDGCSPGSWHRPTAP